jgi:two-component system, NtrC family, sensor histidine kinase PilS
MSRRGSTTTDVRWPAGARHDAGPGGPPGSAASWRRPTIARLPEPGRILAWVYLFRLAVAGLLFVSVVWAWQRAEAHVTLGAALVLVLAGVGTAAAFWYTHLLRRSPGRSFLYSQALFDTALVTWIVFITGGASSALSPLYILVIWAAAILLPFVGGLLIALLASVLYVATVVWSSHTSFDGGVLLQLLLFTAVALLTGYLGDRLRQTGTALGEAEAQLDLLRLDTTEILDTINTGILTVDGAGRLAYMNPAAAELLGMSPAQWQGAPVIEALDRAAPGLGQVIEQTKLERRPIARYEAGDVQDGSFVLGVSTTLVERDGEHAAAVTAIFQNITEKVRIEQLKRRAERLEALAELSASLAHEIKNPLASIRSAAEQLAIPDIDGDDKKVLSGLVVNESGRVSRLLAEFLDFARVKVTEPMPVDLGAVVRHAVSVVRQHPDSADRSIDLSLPAGELLVRIRGAEDLLHRAVLNLVLNAVQWAGPGGRVRVSLQLERSAILAPMLGERPIAQVRVADDGPGIDAEVLEHIFNPFFTQRAGGTGLGLAMVQRAAEAHGGVVLVDDPGASPGAGAAFTLFLPALEDDATDISPTPGPETAVEPDEAFGLTETRR